VPRAGDFDDISIRQPHRTIEHIRAVIVAAENAHRAVVQAQATADALLRVERDFPGQHDGADRAAVQANVAR
jgi:hypothetical protein